MCATLNRRTTFRSHRRGVALRPMRGAAWATVAAARPGEVRPSRASLNPRAHARPVATRVYAHECDWSGAHRVGQGGRGLRPRKG